MEKAIVTVLNFTPAEVAVIQVRTQLCPIVHGVGHLLSLCCTIDKTAGETQAIRLVLVDVK